MMPIQVQTTIASKTWDLITATKVSAAGALEAVLTTDNPIPAIFWIDSLPPTTVYAERQYSISTTLNGTRYYWKDNFF